MARGMNTDGLAAATAAPNISFSSLSKAWPRQTENTVR